MATQVHDDYLHCADYEAHINNKSTAHPGFITFEKGGDHYFAWVNGDQIVLRSEAYPDAEKMERGIKAILKNCDLVERYSVKEENGLYLLLLWGGGNHQEHTGNREQHSEIGRSCPHKSRAALNALLQFKGSDFANKVVPIESGNVATATAVTAAAATAFSADIPKAVAEPTYAAATTATNATNYTSDVAASAGSSLGWLKWLLPLLLLAGAFFWWKSCDKKDTDATATTTTGADTANKAAVVPLPKVTVDTLTGVVNYDLGATGELDLGGGAKLTDIAKDGFENNLVNFIKTGKVDTVNKKLNWFTVHDVQFVTNKTEYATPKAFQQIKNTAAILKAYPNVVLKIGGYTDISGDPTKNKDLSDRRAKQVMKDLLANGAAANQIKEAVGYGSDFAEAKLGDKEGMARDRKTAIKVASM